MCGITGIFIKPSCATAQRLDHVAPMSHSIQHRGPDDAGVWSDANNGIALGFRRLAIVDLSATGHQPMASHSQDLMIVFNGEAYNFAELRSELQGLGVRFRGSSDTEVILSSFERFGIEPTLNRLAGMFAMAVWDRPNKRLHLIRDRIGKKPLYVATLEDGIIFASELKALQVCPDFRPQLSPDAVHAVLRLGWVPDHACIWKNAFKIPPGCMLTLNADDLTSPTVSRLQGKVHRWWSLEMVAREAEENPFQLSDEQLTDELDEMLRLVVGQRMVADVPVGAFLSGGIDSSVIVAMMQQASQQPVRTFSIGFSGTHYDEAPHAASIARHLGSEHVEFNVTSREAMQTIPDLPHFWDEPFADESQIPTLILARLARQHVTVALTGDGGDECFAGYNRHVMLQRLAPVLQVPLAIRRPVSGMLNRINADTWDRLAGMLPLPNAIAHGARSENLQKIANTLNAAGDGEFHDLLLAFGPQSVSCRNGETVPQLSASLSTAFHRIIYRDMMNYLPGDILVKTDRATMAASLEARCPLLDHRLIEFALRLPDHAKVRHNQGKWLLRQVLRRYVPERLYERPKHGFNVPIGQWLREPLRDWAHALLFRQHDELDSLLDFSRVELCWSQHVSGKRDNGRELWALLMLKSWYKKMGSVGQNRTNSPRAQSAVADHTSLQQDQEVRTADV